MNTRIYSRVNVDLKKLSKKIALYFWKENFEVVFLSDSNDPPSWYLIQGRQSSMIKKIIGARKSVEIAIRGKPDNFEVSLTNNEKLYNVASSVISCSVIGIATLGAAVPVAAVVLVAAVAIGTTLYASKRFTNTIWNLIDSRTSDLEDSGREAKLNLLLEELALL